MKANKPKGYWTYERCYEAARKFDCTKQFRKEFGGAYNKAFSEGWLKDYYWFPTRKPKGYWNYEHGYEEAQKYKTRVEFYRKGGTAYNVALKNKWLDDYYWHLTEFEARSTAHRNIKKKEAA